jgi:hypothetical protein
MTIAAALANARPALLFFFWSRVVFSISRNFFEYLEICQISFGLRGVVFLIRKIQGTILRTHILAVRKYKIMEHFSVQNIFMRICGLFFVPEKMFPYIIKQWASLR